MMDAQTRIKMTIGDMVINLSAAHARIEELEAEVAKLKEEKMPTGKSNGKGEEHDRPAL